MALCLRWQKQFHKKRSVAANMKLLSVKSGLVSVGEMEEAESEIYIPGGVGGKCSY